MFDYKAVDKYSPDQLDWLVATGFLRMGPDSTYSTEQNNLPERLDVVATQIEILSSSTMGLTLACARCHDHKYDPLPQRDYYRLSAILKTAYDPYDWLSPSMGCIGVGAKCDESNTRLLPLPSAGELRQVEEYNAPIQRKIAELERQLEEKARPLRKKLLEEKMAALPQSPAAGPERGLKGEARRSNPGSEISVGQVQGYASGDPSRCSSEVSGLCRDLQGDRGADQG